MASRTSTIADPGLASAGEARIGWADAQMPVLAQVRERFAAERPLDGLQVAACLHVTAETANLARTLVAGGAQVALCAANPLATQDDVAAALVAGGGVEIHAVHGESGEDVAAHVVTVLGAGPALTLDDGADLMTVAHFEGYEHVLEGLIGGTEETTTGLVRLRAMEGAGTLACPVLAVNEALAERAFNDRFGAGQSVLDGILRATNLLLAGRTLVVFGYGWTGKGIAQRARGAGAAVIVCEVDAVRALEARMEGYEVMPGLEAAERGDVFVTATGNRGVIARQHLERMKDGAVLANAGHFDVEIDLDALAELAAGRTQVRPLVEQFDLGERRLNLLAAGRVVNLAAAEGHPAAVMDVSFAVQALAAEHLARSGGELAPGVHPVPEGIDREVARLKLASMGVEIDVLSDEQTAYAGSWEGPEAPPLAGS
jgi:adenosylhomocysteinase